MVLKKADNTVVTMNEVAQKAFHEASIYISKLEKLTNAWNEMKLLHVRVVFKVREEREQEAVARRSFGLGSRTTFGRERDAVDSLVIAMIA